MHLITIFLGSFLSKLAGPLVNVAVPLAKDTLTPQGITAAASAIDARIKKTTTTTTTTTKNGPGTTTLIISNKKMNEIMEIIQAVEDSNILLKGVTKIIKNEQKGGFLGMLLGTLGASLLGNMLAGKGIIRAGSENKKGKGIVRAGYEKE